MLQYFFECYFNQAESYENLDYILNSFKEVENKECLSRLASELNLIISKKAYTNASKIIKKYGCRTLTAAKTEKLLIFIHNKLLNIFTEIKAIDFIVPWDDRRLLDFNVRLPTDALTWFFRCHFNGMLHYEDLDDAIEGFQKGEEKVHQYELMNQLNNMIQKNNYTKALQLIKKYSNRKPSLKKTEKLVKFIYNRLSNIATDIKPTDFRGR